MASWGFVNLPPLVFPLLVHWGTPKVAPGLHTLPEYRAVARLKSQDGRSHLGSLLIWPRLFWVDFGQVKNSPNTFWPRFTRICSSDWSECTYGITGTTGKPGCGIMHVRVWVQWTIYSGQWTWLSWRAALYPAQVDCPDFWFRDLRSCFISPLPAIISNSPLRSASRARNGCSPSQPSSWSWRPNLTSKISQM